MSQRRIDDVRPPDALFGLPLVYKETAQANGLLAEVTATYGDTYGNVRLHASCRVTDAAGNMLAWRIRCEWAGYTRVVVSEEQMTFQGAKRAFQHALKIHQRMSAVIGYPTP